MKNRLPTKNIIMTAMTIISSMIDPLIKRLMLSSLRKKRSKEAQDAGETYQERLKNVPF